MKEVLLLWQVGLIANVKLHFSFLQIIPDFVTGILLLRSNMVVELLTHSVDGCTSTEVQDILEYLCTE